MENIKYLLRFLFKLAVVAFFSVIVWWGVVTFNPAFRSLSLYSLNTSSTTPYAAEGWLPSPRTFKGLLSKPKTPGENDFNSPVYGQVFNGYGTQEAGNFDYITYRESGVEMAKGNGVLPSSKPFGQVATTTSGTVMSPYSQKNLYVRNLSIYEGGHVYTGLSFVGEAREALFINGKFPVIIADKSTGKALSVSYAEATTNWTVPGWVKFKVVIQGALPVTIPCLMIFEQARAAGSQVQSYRVNVPVICN